MAADDVDSGQEDASPSTGKVGRRKGRFGLLTVALLVAEAAVIGGGFMLLSGPAETEAVGMSHELDEPLEEITLEEVVIFDGSLGNESTGVALRYPTRIFLKVDARDRLWVEAEASRSAGTIHAQVSEIWKLASRRELESPDLTAMESRIHRCFEREHLFDRRPSVMPTATIDAKSDTAAAGSMTTDTPDGAIVHEVIVVMDIGRRVHR